MQHPPALAGTWRSAPYPNEKLYCVILALEATFVRNMDLSRGPGPTFSADDHDVNLLMGAARTHGEEQVAACLLQQCPNRPVSVNNLVCGCQGCGEQGIAVDGPSPQHTWAPTSLRKKPDSLCPKQQ